jgi:hypothetical protein
MIKRRDFIVAGVSAGVTAGGMHLLYTSHSETPLAPTKAPAALILETGHGQQLDDILLSLENSERIATAWIEKQATQPSIAKLTKTLAQKFDLSSPALEKSVYQQVQQDFASGKTANLDGWTLSTTECELAALRHLVVTANPDNIAILRAQEKAKLEAGLTVGEIAPLKNWGPQTTTQGKKFNEQPDGHSGLWFQLSGAPGRVKIMIDGEIVRTVVNETVVTSGLFGEMQDRILSNPGKYEIALIDPIKNIKQPIGELTVKADPRMAKKLGKTDSVFCEITSWGPKKTTIGKPANEQPDGSMGVWVKTSCFPDGAQIMLDDDLLPTTTREFGATSSIPAALLETPGEKTLYFFDEKAQETIKIGTITIEA